MAQRNRFSPTDLLVMPRLPQVFSLMDETLFSEVSQRFREVVASVSTPARTRHGIRHSRYLILGPITTGKNLSCGLGYWFSDAEYPMAGVMLGMDPYAPQQASILVMVRELSQEPGWEGYSLNRPRNWPSVI